VVELHALTISALALHSKTCSNKNKYALFPGDVSQLWLGFWQWDFVYVV